MKKLLVFAGAMTIVASVYSQVIPRVYDYKASVKTTVAKFASNVKWTDTDGNKWVEDSVCYRVGASVKVTGVLWTDCWCPDFGQNVWDYWNDDVFMVNSSLFPNTVYHNIPESFNPTPGTEDYVAHFVGEEPNAGIEFWNVERWGSALPNKATKASMNFVVWMDATNCPERDIVLWNAGQGSAKVIELANDLEIVSISGNAVGYFETPYCSASSGCPACSVNGICAPAWGYIECPVDYVLDNGEYFDYLFYPGMDNPLAYFGDTAAFGTFSFKYNSSKSKGLKPLAALADQINYLGLKTFGSNAMLK
jgi:hypothetical protein